MLKIKEGIDLKESLIARINRQECEIHNLKEELEAYKKERKNILDKSKRLNYKTRIDKALEYIDENYLDVSYTYEKSEKLKCIVLDKIKEILKGSEKE